MRTIGHSWLPFTAFVFISLFAFLPHTALAHGGGLTFTATTTDYFVDVDYEAYTIEAGSPGRFDFKLFKDAARTKPVDFTQVWVRIVEPSTVPEGDTVFSGWITRSSYGTTGFTTVLPQSGAHLMTVRYNKGDEKIVEATLPFTVDPGTTPEPLQFGKSFWVGVLAGVGLLTLAFAAWNVTTARRRA